MKGLLEEYGKVLLYVIVGTLLLFGFFNLINDDFATNVESQLNATDTPHADTNLDYLTKPHPQIIANDSIKIDEKTKFDVINTPKVKATDGNGTDITSKLLVYGEISGIKFNGSDWVNKRNITVNTPGVYTLRYSIRDSKGLYNTQEIQIIVEAIIS